MARVRTKQTRQNVGDYRHKDARRRNNPPAGIAPTYEVRERKVQHYAYDPHLDPQLQWAGKAERASFEVDVVSLHIHERISTRAILEAIRKPEPQIALFGETHLPLNQQIDFYQHDVNWANRLILGDSLLVMNSLLVKEGMAGKVQMIYVDPPYGIKYASNFQPRIGRRDVKDKDEDLTHEPEQIKAYRDTWQLGIHSYLTYMRDRLLLCRDLLCESGFVFVQINDENLHFVRSLLDEVFGHQNFVSQIAFITTTGRGGGFLDGVYDVLLCYTKDKDRAIRKYRQLFKEMDEQDVARYFQYLDLPDGRIERLTPAYLRNGESALSGRRFTLRDTSSQGESASGGLVYEFEGQPFRPPRGRHWSTTREGLDRLAYAGRLFKFDSQLRTKRYLDDISVTPMNNIWDDTQRGAFVDQKVYAVQTPDKVVERCILMTTDPGDLILDPTCGSGTAAHCAEKWGRRWITCDTSRVALAIARQRLMTARYEYYELADPGRGPAGGFVYETVPHVTLESIAKNAEIDAIAAKYQPQIDDVLAGLNKLLRKQWKEWEVPHQPETGWSEPATGAHEHFWALKREMRQEIDASIQRNAPQEVLYDRPRVRSGVVRVSGPFTVEAIPVPAIADPSQSPIPQFEQTEAVLRVADLAGEYLTTMLNLLTQQGSILFPGGKRMNLQNLRPLNVGVLHAEAEAKQNGKAARVAISIGPEYGPVTAVQTDEAIRTARRSGYDVLVLAGFSIEAAAQAIVQETPIPGLTVHFANVAADALMQVEEAQGNVSLLKTTRASQVFSVFGQPDVRVKAHKDGTWVAELRGVDIYDPITGEVQHTSGDDVAAWFLDTDYDGMTFHICQAFFPGDSDAWEKLQRALRAQIDPKAFERMRGTKSFPFEPGTHRRVAAKVIDFRGNEVIRVLKLNGGTYDE
jgi:adenine-specific DNA-methyltransferase